MVRIPRLRLQHRATAVSWLAAHQHQLQLCCCAPPYHLRAACSLNAVVFGAGGTATVAPPTMTCQNCARVVSPGRAPRPPSSARTAQDTPNAVRPHH